MVSGYHLKRMEFNVYYRIPVFLFLFLFLILSIVHLPF